MKKACSLIKQKLKQAPLAVRLFLSFGAFALFAHILCLFSKKAADFLGATLGSAVRTLFAYLSGWLPFSLAEMLLVGLPLWIILAVFLLRRYLKKGGSAKRALALFLSLLPLLYALFVFMLGFGYLSTPLAERLELENKEKIEARELYSTALWLIEEAKEELSAVTFSESGSSMMPLTHREMNKALKNAFYLLEKDLSFLSAYPVGTKAVLLSTPMAYTGITGVYSFFTGESNICTAYPDYSTVYTAAHEISHAVGIAREDEANFIAFLALEKSDHPYLRYAAYVNLLQYTMNALYSTDKALHTEAARALPEEIRGEYRAYNRFLDTVGDHPVRDVAEGINNAYLESVGTEGTVSYTLVVRLGVAYARTKTAE